MQFCSSHFAAYIKHNKIVIFLIFFRVLFLCWTEKVFPSSAPVNHFDRFHMAKHVHFILWSLRRIDSDRSGVFTKHTPNWPIDRYWNTTPIQNEQTGKAIKFTFVAEPIQTSTDLQKKKTQTNLWDMRFLLFFSLMPVWNLCRTNKVVFSASFLLSKILFSH